MKHDNITGLYCLESPFKVLDCATSLRDMTHFEQHCESQTSNGLDVITLDKAEIKHKGIGSTGVQGELGALVWR